MAMPTDGGKSPVSSLAGWFWSVILEREDEPWGQPHFRRYLAEAKKVIREDNADIEVLKQALLDMKAANIKLRSLSLPLLWQCPGTEGRTWYEVAEEEKAMSDVSPPVYDIYAHREWEVEREIEGSMNGNSNP